MFSMVLQRSEGLATHREFISYCIDKRTRQVELSRSVDLVNSYDAAITCMTLDNQDERYLLCGLGNGVIVIYDLEDAHSKRSCTNAALQSRAPEGLKPVCTIGRSNKSCHKNSVETVQWYPFDTGIFTSSSTDKALQVWDANLLKAAETIHFPSVIYSHHMSAVASEHNLIAVGTDSSHVKLIDMRTGSRTHSLSGHQKAAPLVRWSPKLPFSLATGSRDCRVLLWDIRMARSSLMTLDQYNGNSAASPESVSTAHNGHVLGMVFTDDGHHLLTYGADNRLRLWETATAKNTLMNYGKIANSTKQCVRLCISGGTRRPVLYVPSNDTIRTYDVFGGQLLQTLTGHLARVTCCVCRSYIQELYSSSADRNLLLWTPDFESENFQAVSTPSMSSGSRPGGSALTFTSRTGAVVTDRWSSSSDDDG